MIPAAARPVAMAGGERTEARSPLAQLLHALNQPLTGLQCSMEVALASPRTVEQYVQGLREGLQLTERMRALVEAMREVTDFEPEKETEETTELISLLRETVRDLEPVAQTKDVRLSLDSASGSSSSSLLSSSLSVRVGRARLAVLLFRLLDAALSLAERGTALRIDAGSEPNLVWISVRWQAAGPRCGFSRPELGLLVAQAGCERSGAAWERERIEDGETVRIGLAAAAGGNFRSPAKS